MSKARTVGFELEAEITAWRDCLRAKGGAGEAAVAELETHLREEIGALRGGGLAEDEAFLIACKRLGNADAIAREFAKAGSERLWKQLLIDPEEESERRQARREILLVICLALLAGILISIPELFGMRLFGAQEPFYLRNMSLFLLPSVAAYFAWKRRLRPAQVLAVFAPFVLVLAAVNLYPYAAPRGTQILAGIHAPILLWLCVGLSYAAGQWTASDRRMDFLRFTGETFVYTVLILCGGGVLSAFVLFLFQAIGWNAVPVMRDIVVPIGAAAAPMVASFLAESKRSVIENIAPVLARIFSPLFLAALLAFLAVMAATGKSPFADRNTLIGFDLVLAVVLALVIYVISARQPRAGPGLFDGIALALVVAALIADAVALSAILTRITDAGFTANKTAALGENLLLLANLGGLAVGYVLFLLRRREFRVVTGWQTAYLPAYAAWAAVVVFAFPVLFRFQ